METLYLFFVLPLQQDEKHLSLKTKLVDIWITGWNITEIKHVILFFWRGGVGEDGGKGTFLTFSVILNVWSKASFVTNINSCEEKNISVSKGGLNLQLLPSLLITM